jgi:hypothetical protein
MAADNELEISRPSVAANGKGPFLAFRQRAPSGPAGARLLVSLGRSGCNSQRWLEDYEMGKRPWMQCKIGVARPP